MRGGGSVSIPVWSLVVASVAILGVFTWLILSLRRYARASALVLHSATWGAGDRIIDVTHVLRSKLRDGTLVVRATNDVLGPDPCHGIGKYLRVEYSYKGKQMTRSVPESETLSIP